MREAPGPLAIDDLDSGTPPAVDRPRELRVDPTRRRGQMTLSSHEARRCRGRVAGIGLHVVERCGHGPFEGRARGLAARLHVGRFDEVVGQQLLGQLVEAVLVGRDAVVEREVERRLGLRIVLGPRRGRQGLDLGPKAILAQAEERADGRSVCLEHRLQRARVRTCLRSDPGRADAQARFGLRDHDELGASPSGRWGLGRIVVLSGHGASSFRAASRRRGTPESSRRRLVSEEMARTRRQPG